MLAKNRSEFKTTTFLLLSTYKVLAWINKNKMKIYWCNRFKNIRKLLKCCMNIIIFLNAKHEWCSEYSKHIYSARLNQLNKMKYIDAIDLRMPKNSWNVAWIYLFFLNAEHIVGGWNIPNAYIVLVNSIKSKTNTLHIYFMVQNLLHEFIFSNC